MTDADEAIEAAFVASPEQWRALARRAVRYCAHRFDDFTTDEIWAALDSGGYVRPEEPRALGGVIRSARTEGLIEPTGQYRCGDRRHGAPLRVWRITHEAWRGRNGG